ncbi:MAG: hypothetical protein ACKOI2_09710 [Actinomycetota bacterium]
MTADEYCLACAVGKVIAQLEHTIAETEFDNGETLRWDIPVKFTAQTVFRLRAQLREIQHRLEEHTEIRLPDHWPAN